MQHTEFKQKYQSLSKSSNFLVRIIYKFGWMLLRWGYGLLLYMGEIAGHVPWLAFRLFVYRYLLRIKVGKQTVINRGIRFYHPFGIRIGDHTVINADVFLDGREGLYIGENVNIGSEVCIFTYEHDPQSSMFDCKGGPVVIEDYVWVSTRAMILPNVTVGRGAVIAAGAVVTRDVQPYTIVGGVPAKPIGVRTRDLRYQFDRYHISFH